MTLFWLDSPPGPVAHTGDYATMQAATNKTRLIFFAAAALALASCFYWRSDVHRLSLFRAHRSDYETLLNMLQHDESLTFINSGLTVPEDPTTKGISPQRIAEYRRYMSKIGCGSIGYTPGIGSATFTSDTPGAADILYFPIQSAAVAKRNGLPLDKPPAQAHHIEGNWYLASEDFR
jgi:hypothetical protein